MQSDHLLNSFKMGYIYIKLEKIFAQKFAYLAILRLYLWLNVHTLYVLYSVHCTVQINTVEVLLRLPLGVQYYELRL